MSYGGAVTLSLTGAAEGVTAAVEAMPKELSTLHDLVAAGGGVGGRDSGRPSRSKTQTNAGARGGDTARNPRKK
jgi:hypothetical protein